MKFYVKHKEVDNVQNFLLPLITTRNRERIINRVKIWAIFLKWNKEKFVWIIYKYKIVVWLTSGTGFLALRSSRNH
jgi:hypothetical protein